MTHTTYYTLTRGDEEIEVEVEYSVARYYPAQTYGPPEHCSPAEGGEIEELAAFTDSGEEIKLTAEEEREIEQHIYATHDYDDDDDGDYYEDDE